MKKIFNSSAKLWFLYFVLLLAVIIGIIKTSSSFSDTKSIRLATGLVGSDSYAYGLSYKALLEDENVKVSIVPTLGSLDTIGYLHSNQADIGFVQSGILNDDKIYGFESLASVYFEPMWIFYRNDGYSLDYIIELIDKNVGISITNDGTYEISKKILDANGINNTNTNISYIYNKQALKFLKNKKIDIFITLATQHNSYIKELLEDPAISVLSLKRAKAYKQRFESFKNLELNEGSIDLYKNIPDSTIVLLSTTQNLVSRSDTPDEIIRILLKKVKQIHKQEKFFQDVKRFPNLDNLDTAINDEAMLYLTYGDSWLEEIFPYWIASNIDRLKLLLIPLIGLLIPLFRGIIPLYIFTIRSKIFRWYERLHKLDQRIKDSDKNEFADISKELLKLKDEIGHKTKVPLAYMGEYYNLIVHIELLQNKISKYV